MRTRYLVFDAGCDTCQRIATAIGAGAVGRLELLNLGSAAAISFLDRALPLGWKHAPYLVEVSGSRVRAWTGKLAKLRLGLLLGPRRSWHVWRVWRRIGRDAATRALPGDRGAGT